jgi:hypothetical protein
MGGCQVAACVDSVTEKNHKAWILCKVLAVHNRGSVHQRITVRGSWER